MLSGVKADNNDTEKWKYISLNLLDVSKAQQLGPISTGHDYFVCHWSCWTCLGYIEEREIRTEEKRGYTDIYNL